MWLHLVCAPVEMLQVFEVGDVSVLPEQSQVCLLIVVDLRSLLRHNELVQVIALVFTRERQVQVLHVTSVAREQLQTLKTTKKSKCTCTFVAR